ncbi:MAG: phospholipase A2 [Thermoleophilaceae bacterium]
MWPWFNFTAACANHDACYAAQQAQANCDLAFRNDRYAHCATRPWDQRGLCRSTANVLYDAVRRFGHSVLRLSPPRLRSASPRAVQPARF